MDHDTSAPIIPEHVPKERVLDIDLFDLPGGGSDALRAWKAVQETSPDIFYWPKHGGYWVLNRATLLAEAFPDFERFASTPTVGIPAIPGAPPQLPIDCDPPLHAAYRRPINVALLPRAVRMYAEEARSLAIELIEGLAPRGRCEFVADFARQLPMTIFLRLVDLPVTDREQLIGLADRMIRGGTPEAKYAALMETFAYLDKWVHSRREHPGDDLLSRIIRMQVEGRQATHQEALGECALVLFGGLDTVAGTMSFITKFLAENAGHRRQLAENQALIPAAIEELIRRHSIPTLGRRVTRDLEFGGIHMKKDDRVMLVTSLHGLDERAWPNPMEVDFTRDTASHMGFGSGPHKCPGANLARAEVQVFLEEWLKRIPEFTIPQGEQAETTTGQVLGVARLPLVW